MFMTRINSIAVSLTETTLAKPMPQSVWMPDYLEQTCVWLGMLSFHKQRVEHTFHLNLPLFYTKENRQTEGGSGVWEHVTI